MLSGRRSRLAGQWFVDATGDGTVGFLAGADYEVEKTGHLGTSNLWYTKDTGKPVPFPRCPWALDLTEKPFPTRLDQLGHWYWESGFDLDTIRDAEAIRDHNLRAMYGAWDCLKNVKRLYPNHALAWAAYVAGKRESRRLMGDVVLTQEHVLSGFGFPDGCVAATWSIDLHYPDPKYAAASPGNEFLSVAKFTHFKAPYPVPYWCLYSRNVPNLWMAGRCISVTHEALGTVRVMGTGGLMGEVVGRAAAVCKRHGADPRDVYTTYLDEFIALLKTRTRATPSTPIPMPQDFAGAVGDNIAPLAKVTTSGERDGSAPAEAMVDRTADQGDNSGRWLSNAQTPLWVQLQWDTPRSLVAARVISGYCRGDAVGDPLEDFTFQYHDGHAWRDLPGAAARANPRVDWHARFAPVRTSRVRLQVEKTQGNIARIWEIELYEPRP